MSSNNTFPIPTIALPQPVFYAQNVEVHFKPGFSPLFYSLRALPLPPSHHTSSI